MAGMIPKYDRQVGSQSLPGARLQNVASPEAFGAGVARGLGDTAQGWQKYQEEVDRNAVIEAKSNLDAGLNSYFYNEDSGILNKKGKDALNVATQYDKDYDTMVGDLAKNLNKRQQGIFYQYAMGQKPSYGNVVQRHQTAQHREYTVANAKVAIGNAVKFAIINPTDEDANKMAIDTIRKTVMSVDGHLGDDYVNSQVSDEITNMRIEQINGMLTAGKGFDAQEFFNKHKGDIDPTQYDTITAKIDRVIVPQKARTITDVLTKKFGVTGERAALAELKEKYGNDPDYDIYSRTLQAEYVDQRRLKKEDEEREQESVLMQALGANTASEAQELVNKSNLPPTKKLWIVNQVKARDKVLGSGKATEDQKTWAKYEKNGGLFKDLQSMREFQELSLMEDKELTPQQKTKYAIVQERLSRYYTFSSGGGFAAKQLDMINPKLGAGQGQQGNSVGLQDTFGQTPSNNSDESSNTEDSQTNDAAWYDQTFRTIKDRYPDATDEEIYEFMTEKINQNGG